MAVEPTVVGEATEPSETPLGLIGLTTGETYRLARRVAVDTSGTTRESDSGSGGVIYTEHDMPTLEALLEEYRVAVAVLERPTEEMDLSPISENKATATSRGETPSSELVLTQAPWRIAVAGVLAGAFAAVGIVLMVSAGIPGGLRANPYMALVLFLGGVTFVATLVRALRG
jgi:hypothetical protein